MPADPLIVNLAPTGMVPTKAETPHVPITTEEILEDVADCRELGLSIVHVHARDESGAPAWERERFAPIVEGIRAIDPELIVCVTCSGRHVAEVDRRADVLELEGDARPDMASLTLGSNNFARQSSVNSPDDIRALAERMRDRGVKPELEAFEPGMVGFARHLASRGVIDEPCYVNVLLGNVATAPLSASSLAAFLSLVPRAWTWALGGIGRFQTAANMAAVALGGHVRVGIEDNIWLDPERTVPASNRELIERVVRTAQLAGRPLASPASTRTQLGLARARPRCLGAPLRRPGPAPTLRGQAD